jgi:protein-S-isoprenylcysteine O-methyltransferase Ste14
MKRILAIIGSVIFLVLAPGIVAGYVPWLICRWHVGAPLPGMSSCRVLGVLLCAAGLLVLLDSFARFALQGLGTPAPIFPTRHLVVGGLFRYVRNPMYVAVLSLIIGQALFFGSIGVLEYGIAVWVAFISLWLSTRSLRCGGVTVESTKNSARMSPDGFPACDLGGAPLVR